MINGLVQLINDQNIGPDRLWSFSTIQGNIQCCKIVDMKPSQNYIIVEEWYYQAGNYIKSDSFDLNCINVEHIIWAQLHKEEA